MSFLICNTIVFYKKFMNVSSKKMVKANIKWISHFMWQWQWFIECVIYGSQSLDTTTLLFISFKSYVENLSTFNLFYQTVSEFILEQDEIQNDTKGKSMLVDISNYCTAPFCSQHCSLIETKYHLSNIFLLF